MNEKEIPTEGKHFQINKKPVYIMAILIAIGIITGLIVSNYFLVDANQSIEEWNEGIDSWNEKWGNYSWDNHSWGNYSWDNYSSNNTSDGNFTQIDNVTSNDNTSWADFYQHLTPLTYSDVILQIITVILLCISSYFLLAVNITYIKIYKSTKSKYIIGLFFVFTPLLIVSCFFIRVVKSLFFSSALEFNIISPILGFGISGLGGMLSILSVFMILGSGILIYLSNT